MNQITTLAPLRKRGRTLHIQNPLIQIYESRCRDAGIPVIPEMRDKFIKSQKEEKLILDHSNIKNIQAIADNLFGITHLSLQNNPFQDHKYLALKINASQLIHLDISNNSPSALEVLNYLDSKSLISLNVSGIRFNVQSLKTLSKLKLQFLFIRNCQINDLKYNQLNLDLIYLDISGNSINQQILPNIEHLNVANNNLKEIYFKIDLLQLNLSNNPLNFNSQMQLARAIKGSRLEKLILDYIILTAGFIPALVSEIEYLSMTHCGIQQIDELFNNNRQLKTLILNDNFNLVIKRIPIPEISLDRCFFDQQVIYEFIKSLNLNNQIKYLCIKDTYLGPETQKMLATVLDNSSLQRIECTCGLSADIQFKLKRNMRRQLLSVRQSHNIDPQEFNTIEIMSEKFKSKRNSLVIEVNENEQNFSEFKNKQYGLTNRLKILYEDVHQQDLNLNFELDDIRNQKLTYIKETEVDVVYYTHQICKCERDSNYFITEIERMKNKIKNLHQLEKDKKLEAQSLQMEYDKILKQNRLLEGLKQDKLIHMEEEIQKHIEAIISRSTTPKKKIRSKSNN